MAQATTFGPRQLYRGPERRAASPKGYAGVERRAPADLQRTTTAMDSKARFLGHSVHQQLVVFPIGLLATAVLFDLVYLGSESTTAALVSCWIIAVGVVSALLAAPFGTIDWLAIPAGTRAKAIGAMHGGGNLVVVALFVASWLMRYQDPMQPPPMALWLSIAGGLLALVTAWLGGELVSRLGIGIAPAGANASSSLRDR